MEAQQVKENTMTKIDALRILSNAYWYLHIDRPVPVQFENDAQVLIEDRFGYVRRSMSIKDLRPVPVVHEGYNGRMSTHF
jgi:hypothetical protein